MAGKKGKKPNWILDDVVGKKGRDKRYKNPMEGVIVKDIRKHKRKNHLSKSS